MPVPQWFEDRLAWKKASTRASLRCINYFGVPYGPNLADLSGTSSTRIAGEVYRLLDIPVDKVTDLDLSSIEALKELQTDDEVGARARARASNNELIAAGTQLEADLEIDIHEGLIARDPDRGWYVTRHGRVSQFAQYQHLEELQKLFESNPTLKTTVGRDYQVSTDVMVGLPNQWAGGPEHVLHAAVSSKLTLRSDRAQNVRVEFGTLVRNRRGRLPHLVVVTAEPLPSRIVSWVGARGRLTRCTTFCSTRSAPRWTTSERSIVICEVSGRTGTSWFRWHDFVPTLNLPTFSPPGEQR